MRETHFSNKIGIQQNSWKFRNWNSWNYAVSLSYLEENY